MLKLKVCGMREEENIHRLSPLNPDIIGLIFYNKSSRNVDTSNTIIFPQNIKKAGVFVNENEEVIRDMLKLFHLNYIQLHGKESPLFCKKICSTNAKVIKAFNIHENFDFNSLNAYQPYCEYFLFDSFGERAGGNGVGFNWGLLKKYKGKTPFFLSGGIDIQHSGAIKKLKHPLLIGVDINSRFEITPGVKNIQKIKKFKDDLFN